MRNWRSLSDIDFEELSADLLSAELGTPVERFGRGADGGIDLRWSVGAAGDGIAQCKHYLDSSFAQLLKAVRNEVPKVARLNPERYLLLTSHSLTPDQKSQIFSVFAQWMDRPSDVYSGQDLDQLLDKHVQIERKHIKMWLSSGMQLLWATNSGLVARSQALLDRVNSTISNYVGMDAFNQANTILESEGVCLIAGQPGIGKTVLAQMLIAEHLTNGFEVVEVSEDISEAWDLIDPNRPQVFFYDDFLGQLAHSERLVKNEDSRLGNFIAKVRDQKSSRLILTTREYILRDAELSYLRLGELTPRGKYILELKQYSRTDRARILYNHAWRSKIDRNSLVELAEGGWKRVIDHPNFSPRLIEYATSSEWDSSRGSWLDSFENLLNHPSELWRITFETHLNEPQRLVLFTLATFQRAVSKSVIQESYRSLLTQIGGQYSSTVFRRALKVLEGTFITIENDHAGITIRFSNPSILDFVLSEIQGDIETQRDLISSAAYFEQLERLWTMDTSATNVSETLNAVACRSKVLDSSVAPEFARAIVRTYESNPPLAKLPNEGEKPSPLEARLMFIADLPEHWRPPEQWFTDQATLLTQRWSEGCGAKTFAYELLFGVKSSVGPHFPADAEDTVLNWIQNDLENLEDWEVLIRSLSENRIEDTSDDFASGVFDFVLSELEEWDPVPPELESLERLLSEFGITELDQEITEAAAREAWADEIATQSISRRTVQQQLSNSDSDTAISAYFDRFMRH